MCALDDMKFSENTDTDAGAVFFVSAVRTSDINYIYTFCINTKGVCYTMK
jgi:hypothetical protein